MKEKPINLRAIAIGLFVQIVINLLLAVFVFAAIDLIPQGTGAFAQSDIIVTFLTSPKFIFIMLLGLFLGDGLPGYLAARFANKNFMLHGALIGLIASIWTLRPTLSEINYPILVGLLILLLGFLASTAGGWYRGVQVERANKISYQIAELDGKK